MRFIIAAVGIVMTGSACLGQELRWTEPEVVPPSEAPPASLSRLERPDVPRELQKLDTHGYAQVTLMISGRETEVARDVAATNVFLDAAVARATRDLRVSAPTLGPSALQETRLFLIFNPPSVRKGAADSAPRLVRVQAAYLPASHLSRQDGQRRIYRDVLVEVDLQIDAAGAVRSARAVDVPEELGLAAEQAALAWAFEPARKAGAAVEASLRVPVVLAVPTTFDAKQLDTPPVARFQKKPVYPMSQRASGMGGEVLVHFVVDTDGDVRNPVVVQSNNPAFNQPAIDAVSAWRFKPGKVDGQVVNTRMMVPMVFHLDGGSSEPFKVTGKKLSDQLPEELRYDIPPQVLNAALGVYPYQALIEGKKKTVKARFLVAPDGTVRFPDALPQDADDFDRAARAMLEEYAFTPASKKGQPSWGLLNIEIGFNPAGTEFVPVSEATREVLRELKKASPAIYSAKEVDSKPVVVSQRAPIIPADAPENLNGGEVLVEFFVDRDGAVQLPRLISADHPSLGFAAVQAVSHWRFQPMKKDGKPAIVRLRAPLEFKL
jgi:TonB family protein